NSSEDLSNKKRITPTSIAPITFFIREESNWILSYSKTLKKDQFTVLSSIAQEIYDFLKQRGASFFSDIAEGVKHLQTEIETGLWELIAAGVVTADGFDNLRAMIDPKRRLGRRGCRLIPRFSTGRWSLLPFKEVEYSEHLEAVCWMLL